MGSCLCLVIDNSLGCKVRFVLRVMESYLYCLLLLQGALLELASLVFIKMINDQRRGIRGKR